MTLLPSSLGYEFLMQTDDRDKDETYGVRKKSDGDLMIGNEIFSIVNNNLYIKELWYVGTGGLYELLFKNKKNL